MNIKRTHRTYLITLERYHMYSYMISNNNLQMIDTVTDTFNTIFETNTRWEHTIHPTA
jgi:hypothetical protein